MEMRQRHPTHVTVDGIAWSEWYTDDLTYERLRRKERENPEGYEWFGIGRRVWNCDGFRGLQITQTQTNPDRTLGAAEWVYKVRHFIHVDDEGSVREDIATVPVLEEAFAIAGRYFASHIGFAFTNAFDGFFEPGSAGAD